MKTVLNTIRTEVCPGFWVHFKDYEKKFHYNSVDVTCRKVEAISTLAQAVKQLVNDLNSLLQKIERCQKAAAESGIIIEKRFSQSLQEILKLSLRTILHSQAPPCYERLIYEVYAIAFNLFLHKHDFSFEFEDSEKNEDMCRGCEMSNEACQCLVFDQLFNVINRMLYEWGLQEFMTGSVIEEILLRSIEQHIKIACKHNFSSPKLEFLEEWVNRVTEGWYKFVYCNEKKHLSDEFLESKQDMATSHIQYHYTNARITQIFDILVIEFPDSQPALEDLRDCLEKTDLRNTLVKTLSQAIQTRLLQQGVKTEDVLLAYVTIIKGLRILDSKGILLELVSEPIRKYLRGRSDFVRYIARNLTEYTGDLSEELNVSAAPLILDENYFQTETMENWESWMPDPMHASPSLKSKCQRKADIISMLVNIYGSKEIYIREYRSILADRILTHFNFDTKQEVMYLEHLKLRFGDSLSPLQMCEVMVKDVAESKRINSAIKLDDARNDRSETHSFQMSSMVLSKQFWPPFKDQDLKLPDNVTAEMEKYTEAYKSLKGNRTLVWKPNLGQVELDIELKDRTLSLLVTPIKAVIIQRFQEKSKWSLDDLSQITLMSKSVLRRHIAFWQAQGLVRECATDIFVLIDDEDDASKPRDVIEFASRDRSVAESSFDDEADSVMASSHDQRREELQVLWSYIVGMLTNIECLPLDRIHSMLRMFMVDSLECSVEELKMFLDTKVREHKLIFINNTYKLSKD